jgi:hypothetical protein
MSKIATIIGSATPISQTLRVEQRFGKIEVVIVMDNQKAYGSDIAPKWLPEIIGNVSTVLLEVVKQTRLGSETILQKTNLADLLVMGLGNQGMLIAENDFNKKTVTLKGALELTDYGSIPLLDGEFFEITFSEVWDALTITAFAVDFPMQSTLHNVYERLYFNQGSPKEISINNAKTIAFQKSQMERLELAYSNGVNVTYVNEEILSLTRDGLGVVATYNGTAYTFQDLDLCVLNVADVVTAKVTLNTSGTVYKLSHEVL